MTSTVVKCLPADCFSHCGVICVCPLAILSRNPSHPGEDRLEWSARNEAGNEETVLSSGPSSGGKAVRAAETDDSCHLLRPLCARHLTSFHLQLTLAQGGFEPRGFVPIQIFFFPKKYGTVNVCSFRIFLVTPPLSCLLYCKTPVYNTHHVQYVFIDCLYHQASTQQ